MKKVDQFLLIVLLLCLFPLTEVMAQGAMHSVSGTVRDAQTGRKLPQASITTSESHEATVTNAEGDFVLKSDRAIEWIECSFLGFQTRRLQAEERMNIRLRRENLLLTEASIVGADPRAILNAALDNLWDRYCPEPELLECFYRETVQKRSRYTYVAEAVARLYKDRYDGTVFQDAAALEKSRVLVSQRSRDTLSVKTMGGPTQAITHDLIKNREILFNKDDLAYYDYRMERPAYIGDRLQFVIEMIPVISVEYALFRCKVYIDRENLTFSRVEASLDVKDQAKATRMLLVSKPLGLRFFPQEASLVLNYRQVEGKTRLEYFRSIIRFDCDWRKRLFKTRYTTINELVITDVRDEAVPIPRKERFRQRDYLSDKAREFQDPDFWKDYNIIEPTESLEHAIDRLRRQSRPR